MKNNLFVSAVCVSCLVWLAGCGKESSSNPSLGGKGTASAEPTSFAQVTSQLDPGGNLYVYLSTEQLLQGLSDKVARLRQLPESIPTLQEADREKIGKAIDIVTNLIKDSGLEEISGFGISSIAREKGFYHTKSLLHHYKGQGKGFLWSLLGQSAHALDGLDLLPAQTAFATFSDLDLPQLWSVLQKEATQSGFPEAAQALEQWPGFFEQSTGLKWDQVLASLGGEYGFVLTLDDSRKVALPLPSADGPLEIPEPGLMLVAKVKDDTVFVRLEQAINTLGQNVMTNDKPGLKMRTVAIPLPLPIQLRPSMAMSEGYLLIASSDALISEALEVKAGKKPGLKTTEEFKHLAREVPERGNQFSFLSQRFGQTMLRLQRQALSMAPNAGQSAWLQSMLNTTNAGFAYSVSGNTDEGWLSVANGNQNPAKMLAAAAAVPVAIGAAVALPALAKAKARAQQHGDK